MVVEEEDGDGFIEVEVWSVDTYVLLPRVPSIGAAFKDTEADRDSILHLHFRNPTLSKLRSATSLC